MSFRLPSRSRGLGVQGLRWSLGILRFRTFQALEVEREDVGA